MVTRPSAISPPKPEPEGALHSPASLESALALLNRQKLFQTAKCAGCLVDYSPSAQFNIFPQLCVVCTLRKVLHG